MKPFNSIGEAHDWASLNTFGQCSVLVTAQANRWLPVERIMIMVYVGWSHVPLAHSGMMHRASAIPAEVTR